MVGSRTWLAPLVLATATLGACENFRVVHFTDSIDGVSTLTTDAKQRILVSTDASEPKNRQGYVVPKRIVCAEPSPDVAQAISEAIQAGLKADVSITAASGSTHTAGGAANFGRSVSANIAQLGERLAAIQLLRDKMYRACEAYANGAVSATGYTLMLARLDKTMVTMLSNELAAGAFGRALAQVGGSASTGGLSEAEVQKQEDLVKKKAAALEQAAKEKKSEDEIKAAAAALNAEVDKLAWMQRLAVSTSASSNGSAPGAITGAGSRSTEAGSIVAIHRNYVDDDGVEPLIDACITALDRVDGSQVAATAAVARENEKSVLDRLYAELGQLRQKLVDADYNRRQPQFNEGPDWNREWLNLQAMVRVKEQEIERREKQQVAAAQGEVDRIQEALLARNYTFAAFCQKNVLNAAFVNARAVQEKDLRKLEYEEKRIGLVATALQLCQSFHAGKVKVADEQKKELNTACVDAMKTATKN